MSTRTLTGKTLFREHKRWGKPSLLVLQVQERVTGAAVEGGKAESCEYLEFRDIQLTDLKSPLELAATHSPDLPPLFG